LKRKFREGCSHSLFDLSDRSEKKNK
jgi:hypothetical protein